MNRWLPVVATLAASLGSAGATRLHAQGTTTGAITGTVTDANGQPLVSAQVEVVNRATGSRAGQQTRETGRYFVPNLDVGGGYTVTVRRIGYAPVTRNDVRVTLSQATRLDFRLEPQATQLSTVTVTAPTTASDFTPTRQGAQTVVSDTLVRRQPTLNRDVADLTRLTPQVAVTPSGRQSAAGQSNRFSNIQVDGVSLANRFGLGNSPTLGAQVGGRALPLEAIKEFQVLLSPYDVRQGNFTGALVNAVTQSGTNEFHGSAFGYYRDQDIARDDPFVTARPFTRRQFGASLGGPIVRDKLRFFATVETSQNRNPASGPFFDPAQGNGLNGAPTITARVTQAQVDSFTTRAQALGINAGSPLPVTNANPLLNTFGRLDYQISSGNRLVLRNIYNNQQQDDFSRTAGAFSFTSNAFRRVEKSNQTVAQLFSSFGAVSNEAILGYTRTRFRRNPSVIAPQVLVQNIGGTQSGVGFRLGTENSSQGNQLDEDLFEIQDNVTIPLGAHTVTVGTRNEIYKVYNAFLQNSYGNYTFGSLADFVAGNAPTQFSGAGALPGGENDVAARFRAGQFGGYVQDQWTVNPRLTLTLGLRADVPVLFDKPLASPTVQANFGRSTRDVPSGKLQLSPRIGFNSDLTGDQRNQLRGGVGLFQGPPAYVWISNQFTNTGAGFAQFTCGAGNTNGTAPAFNPAPVSPRGCGTLAGFTGNNASLNGTPGRSLDNGTLIGTVNLADPNLKFPQLLRATLGYDRQLPGGVVATLEGLYSKNLNNFLYTNVNLRPDEATFVSAQGRRVYNQIPLTGIPNIIPRFPVYGTNVINLTNQSKDYSYSGTAQLRKRFSAGVEGSVAYTYGRSYSVTDLTSSVALSNYQFGRTFSGSQFETPLAPSTFDQPHRVVVNGTATAPWKRYPTSLTTYFTAASGTPYTYTFGGAGGRGDLNADGTNANDMIYIPTGPADPRLRFQAATFNGVSVSAEQQAVAFDQFVRGDECLDKQRGKLMARNSCRNPGFYTWDVTVEQQLPEYRGNRLSVRADVFNFANLLNRNWGRVRGVAQTEAAINNANFTLLTHQAMTSADPATQAPIVTFDPANLTNRFPVLPIVANYYQMQFSVRYAF